VQTVQRFSRKKTRKSPFCDPSAQTQALSACFLPVLPDFYHKIGRTFLPVSACFVQTEQTHHSTTQNPEKRSRACISAIIQAKSLVT